MRSFTEPARIIISPADVTSQLGQTVFLPCVVFVSANSTVPVSIVWKRNGIRLDSNSNTSVHAPEQNDSVTVIRSILELCLTEVDGGSQYSCAAMQQQDILDEQLFTVTVQHQQSKSIYKSEGKSQQPGMVPSCTCRRM